MYLDSGSAAVSSCSSGILINLGGIPASANSLPRISSTAQVVITRSALAGPNSSSVVAVAVCPTMCRSVCETLRLPLGCAKEGQWKTLSAKESGVEESDTVEQVRRA